MFHGSQVVLGQLEGSVLEIIFVFGHAHLRLTGHERVVFVLFVCLHALQLSQGDRVQTLDDVLFGLF